MANASPKKAPRFLLAAAVGLTAAILARVAIFIASAPHSALIIFSDLWQLSLSCGFGIILFALSYRSAERPTFPAFAIAFIALFLSSGLHWLVFNIPLAQQFLPGIWAK